MQYTSLAERRLRSPANALADASSSSLRPSCHIPPESRATPLKARASPSASRLFVLRARSIASSARRIVSSMSSRWMKASATSIILA